MKPNWTTEHKEAVIAVLVKGLKRIQRGWTQGAMACTVDGRSLPSLAAGSPEACRWCAIGAITDARNTSVWSDAIDTLRAVVAARTQHSADEVQIVWWNDAPGRTQAEVVEVYQQALLRVAMEPTNEPA